MRPRQTRIIVATVVLAGSSALVLTGCSSDSDTNTGLSAQYRDGGTKNYVSGDGTVTQVPPANRKTVTDFDELSARQAWEYLGCSRSTFRLAVALGHLPKPTHTFAGQRWVRCDLDEAKRAFAAKAEQQRKRGRPSLLAAGRKTGSAR